jgi:dienelactone hydrolase
VLLLQGLDDPIVPPRQAESIAADLSAHGIRHALLTFEGESHGFRRAETIIAALEAELSFYGQVLGFTPPGIPQLTLTEPRKAAQEAMAAQEGAAAESRAAEGDQGDAGAQGAGAAQPGDAAAQGAGQPAGVANSAS